MLIEIYSKQNCSFCTRAKTIAQQYLRDNSFAADGSVPELKVFMLDEDFTREQMLDSFPTAKTFPQVRINFEDIGGSSDFETWLLENG
jgi:glutaredoxin